MNKKQRVVLVVGVLAFIVGGALWMAEYDPNPTNLVVGWTMVAVATAGLLVACKSGKPKDKGDA